MSGQKYTLKFITDLDLGNMKQSLNQFQNQLNKLGVPKSLSKSLNSTIESLKSEMKSIESLTSKEFISKSDMNSLASSYDKIDKLIRKINVDSKELNNLGLDKLLPTEQLNRFNQLESTLKKLQPLLNLKTTIPEEIDRLGDKAKTSQSNIEKLNKELKELEDKRSRNIEDQTSARTRTQELKARKSTLEKEQEKLRSKPRGVQSEEYISLQKRIKEARTQVTLLEQDLQKKEAQLKKVESTKTKNPEVKKANVEIAESNVAKAETKLNAEREKLQEMENRARSLRGQKTDGTQLKAYKDNEEALKKLNKEIEESEGQEKELSEKNKETAAAIVDKTSEIKKEQKELEKTNEKIKQLQDSGNVDQSKIDEIKKDIEELTGIKIETNDLEELKEILDNLKSDTIKQTSKDLDQFNEIQSEVEKNAGEVSDSLNEETKAWELFDNKQKEVDGIKARIASFFALDNAIQLVKRTMRSAYETIKELDAAMTETAVVTDFSVGDMWAQLPDYTKRANELGVSTKAAYEAATLYYQQGLKTNEVMAMSNETLKMARIAGLDAAVATDRMTNAIRGFNMEINTTNAQRIDDVYSKLAAISASNVDEISTAMTKVASLAHNANMEFETTAAFLAQIIETTRESAETAGTALKTVVARFSEVKKLVSEGELKGNDEEGELIDVNKVSSALRTAGIDLNKYFLGEVGLDDIFMELASKWKSLTQLQQRFIATQAAGSRQQSRFIALMSDYARTQELVGEAYNANGAAAKQFAKTQESLESKLARLKNAWDEFAMGILNSDIIKWGVDRLTDILNGINALTSGFGALNSGAGKFLNTFAKLTLLMGGLRAGKGLTGGLFGSIGAMVAGNYEKGMFQQYVAKTLEVDPGKNLLGTLGKGIAGQFGGIGKTVGAIAGKPWSLAQKLGTVVTAPFGMGTGKAALTASGGMSWLAGGGLTGTAAGIVGLITALAGVAAAATTAYLIIKKLYDASPAGQVKIAEKYAESMQQAADTAKQTAADFEKVQQEYSALDNAVSNASNLEERTEAIKSRSEYVKSLIEQNSIYAQYLQDTKFENGEFYLTLDSKKLEEACNNIAKAAVEAAAANNLAQSNLAYQEYEKYQAEFEKEQERKTKIQDPSDPAARLRYGEWTEVDEQHLIDLQARMQEKLAESTNYAMQTASNYIDTSELSDTAASYLVRAIGEGLSSDAVSRKIEKEKKEISGDIDEQYYIAFGNLGEGLTKETKKLALAVRNANLSLVEDFKPFISTFEQLPEEAQKVLYEISSNNGYGLTRDEYLKATYTSPQWWLTYKDSKGEKKNILDLIPNEEIRQEILNAFNASLNQENPFDILTESVSEIFQDKQQSNKLLDTFNNITKDLTAEQASVFPRLFKEFMSYGKGSIEDFTTFLTGLINSVPKNKLNDLFNLLDSLNFQDSGTLKVFLESLEDLNPNWVAMGYSAESAAEALKKLTNSIEEFNLDDVREKVVDQVSLMQDIKNRKKTDKVFNQSEYEELIEAGIDPKAFVFQGIKNKEWQYQGGELDELVNILAENLTTLGNELVESLDEKIRKGEIVSSINEKYQNTGFFDENNNPLSVIDVLQSIIKDKDFEPHAGSLVYVRDIFKNLFGQESDILSQDILLERIKEALSYFTQLEFNQNQKPTTEQMIQNPINFVTDINDLQTTDELYTQTISQKFNADEHAADIYERILKSIQQIEKENKEWNKDVNEQVTISQALATKWSQEAAKLTELTEILDKNDKILYESSKDSYEYTSAIHQVGEAMRAAYGKQVSDEFVQAHIQQIVMARESQEAYQELLNLLQEDFFKQLRASSEDAANALDFVENKMFECAATGQSLDDLEFEGVAILDDTPWMEAVSRLINAGIDVEAFFDSLGWTAVLKYTDDGIIKSVQLVRNQPTGYGGYQPYTGSNWGRSPSSGGSGSSPREKEPTKEEWRSDFDWLYNLMEDITELQREQNKLQEEQNKILELGNDSDTGKDLYENLVKQMANLLTQKTYQSTVSGYRRREMQEFMAANAGYGEYFRFNDQDQTLEINWDAINEIGDKETYEKVKDLVSEAEAIQKKMDDSEDAVRDIETQIRQLENIWRESYVNFEKRVLDALIKSYQRVIDNYSDLNDTVTRTNNDILNAIQKEISLERQIRDNTSAEESISDAEARLAFLRRDTTGGNQVEILNAQKELDEQRRQYEDALIDQAIARLQDDNEVAADQRDKQIELMQTQLDYAAETGAFNDQVYTLIAGALGADGELLTNSDLFELLQQEESWSAMSDTNKQVWEDELNNTFKEVSAYLLKQQGEIDGSYLQAVAAQINDGVWASAQVTGNSLQIGLGSIGNALAVGLDSIGWNIGSMSQAINHIAYSFGDAVSALSDANAQLANAASTIQSQQDTINGLENELANAVGHDNIPYVGDPDSSAYWQRQYDEKQLKRRSMGFATGGLTTKTGLAWLDGTPSEPEYVLNARQTEAFLKLADVLPTMLNGALTTTNNVGGTMYLNFDINVDSISNDYDVDQLVERVKDDIYNAASYRNANIINFSR